MSSSLTNNSGKQILIDFRYPVTLTYFQFAFVGVFCYIYTLVSGGRTRIQPLNRALLSLILPVCVFTIFAHLFSSIAIAHVPVSVVHTIKALSPLFTVGAYRLLFGVEYSSRVYTALVPLTAGVMLACSFELSANMLGLLYALLSALVCVAQNIFSKKYVFNDSVPAHIKKSLDKTNYLFYCSWMAFALMFPIWYYSEGADMITSGLFHSSDRTTPTSHTPRLLRAFGFMVVNGFTHFAQCVLSVTVLSMTSAVSFSISSLLKRVFVIVMAIIWFQQPVGIIQCSGILLTFFGLYLYDRAKLDVNKKECVVNRSDEPILPTMAYKFKST
ncbi:triose-phosphate transporter family-domain-containing protein [Dimargaris cristalligena]|uniref:Triose-phosphate transporter family-domain-containing protein n=1 Tax=Dimargaris cristalligena TaxID=215637 RepID=A0A4V1J446_9FUNG|nr:triose-phosphate transporter family-domain-containing protein [Dimargaris cristalligena]|eukprot:RKP34289.1 triose-phosphate transporter family-domain-containing protein [Dimargaris cristalligena]